MATTDAEYLEKTTLKQILNISDEVMDHAMGVAYQLYRAGRFTEADTVCKGLIACDHRYWWSYSLHASVLRHLGCEEHALAQVEQGLKYEPRQPKLLLMRAELLVTMARAKATTSAPAAVAAPSPRPDAQSDTAILGL